MRLALGTAQFGADYGVASSSGIPTRAEVRKILNLAWKAGIDTLDTASAYGNSEQVLGSIGILNWNVVTKVPRYDIEPESVRSWLFSHVQNSLKMLKVDHIHGLLLHDPSALLKSSGRDLAEALIELRGSGAVKNIGFSIYSPDILPSLIAILRPDLIQAPLNIFDQRIIRSGWLDRLTSEGIEVDVRSIFLQGLLIMEPNNRPSYFDKWAEVFNPWDCFVDKSGDSRVATCLKFIGQHENVSRVITGIDNIAHLEQLLEVHRSPAAIGLNDLYCNDSRLIDPFNWKLE